MKNIINKGLTGLDWVGLLLGLLALRLLLGWEYYESGLEKFHGENWFADIQDRFPFPFNIVPPEISWQMATWFELVGGVALVLGLGTRFFAVSLFILTIVATASVHWPAEWSTLAELMQGYAISDQGHGNFKLPVIFMAMFVPLILSGPGKLSLDHLIARRYLGRRHA
ncbi:MAG: DoxX family protein [Rhodocyclaceae bacterium]|jgi:putative oxidoreductase|nr:DoxX family protein [Rhodocyclaceae bacterium]